MWQTSFRFSHHLLLFVSVFSVMVKLLLILVDLSNQILLQCIETSSLCLLPIFVVLMSKTWLLLFWSVVLSLFTYCYVIFSSIGVIYQLKLVYLLDLVLQSGLGPFVSPFVFGSVLVQKSYLGCCLFVSWISCLFSVCRWLDFGRKCVEFKLGCVGSKLDASPLLNFKNFTLWWWCLFSMVFYVSFISVLCLNVAL